MNNANTTTQITTTTTTHTTTHTATTTPTFSTTHGPLRVVDVPCSPPNADPLLWRAVGSASDRFFAAVFVADVIQTEPPCPFRVGDRLLAVDGASLITAAAPAVNRHMSKLRTVGGRVLLQRLPAAEWEAIRKECRELRTQAISAVAAGTTLHVRPFALHESIPAAPAAPAPLQIHIVAVHVQRLQSNSACFVAHDGKLVVQAAPPNMVNINAGDVLVEAAGRSLLSLHDSSRALSDILTAATSDMVLVVVLRHANPAAFLPPGTVAKRAALAAAQPRSLAPPLKPPPPLFPPAAKVSDGALLKRLDDAHLRLQGLMAAEYDPARKMPDISSLPSLSSGETQNGFQNSADSSVDSDSATHVLGSTTVELHLQHPVMDLGFALATLPFKTEGGTVVIHSVWGAHHLTAGWLLLAVDGADVSSSTPTRILKLIAITLLSPSHRHQPLKLTVAPCPPSYQDAWAPNAPRHVLIRRGYVVDQASTTLSCGFQVVAGARQPTFCFVHRLDNPRLSAAIKVGDRICSLNGQPLAQATFAQVQAKLQECQQQHFYLPVELQSQHAGYSIFQPRTVVVQRATVDVGEAAVAKDHDFPGRLGFVVAGNTVVTRDPARASGVYVWHVHDPATCPQLLAGDVILQVNDISTVTSTVHHVRQMLNSGAGAMVLTVKSDPVGFETLAKQFEAEGEKPEAVLVEKLQEAGVAVEESLLAESLGLQPGVETPVEKGKESAKPYATPGVVRPTKVTFAATTQQFTIGRGSATSTSTPTATSTAVKLFKSSGLRNMQRLPLSTRNFGGGDAKNKRAAMVMSASDSPWVAEAKLRTPPSAQATRSMDSRRAVYTPVAQALSAPSPDVSAVSFNGSRVGAEISLADSGLMSRLKIR